MYFYFEILVHAHIQKARQTKWSCDLITEYKLLISKTLVLNKFWLMFFKITYLLMYKSSSQFAGKNYLV